MWIRWKSWWAFQSGYPVVYHALWKHYPLSLNDLRTIHQVNQPKHKLLYPTHCTWTTHPNTFKLHFPWSKWCPHVSVLMSVAFTKLKTGKLSHSKLVLLCQIVLAILSVLDFQINFMDSFPVPRGRVQSSWISIVLAFNA